MAPEVQELRTLRIGLVPEQNIFSQRKRYQPLADYLLGRAGVRLEFQVFSRYGDIIDDFDSTRLDGAFFGSFTGALACRKIGVEALARPEYPDGTSTYHGLLFARKDSGIFDAQDMRGKRFVFVDKATTAGWLLPLYYFKTQGVDDHDAWLGETYFAGTHAGAFYDVIGGVADVGAAKNTVLEALAARDPRLSQTLRILSRSPEVPENGLFVRRDLDASLKSRLRDSLLSMHLEEEGRQTLASLGVRRFIMTTEDDYAVVFEYASEIGIALETYDYRNDRGSSRAGGPTHRDE